MTRRDTSSALAFILLLGVGILGWGCARPARPSGGPVDRIPPMVTNSWPDPFQIIEATRDPVTIDFSERISERLTQGRLEQAVVVSPETGEVQVKHHRSGLGISVVGGFQPGLVYRIRVLNTVKDLFNNPMEGPFEVVFSTGGEFESHVLAGVVTDRITGEPIEQVRVEARELVASDSGVVVKEDAPVYLARTDAEGIYLLRYIPTGSYRITVYQDNNRNREPDFRELKGEAGQTLGLLLPKMDTLFSDVALLSSDSIAAKLIRVEAEDSILLKLSFDDFLLPEDPLESVEVVLTLDRGEEEAPEEEGPEEAGPVVERLLWQRQLDSILAAAESIRALDALRIVADSLRGVADSLQTTLATLQASGDTVDAAGMEEELDAIRARLEPPEEEEEEETPPPPILPEPFFYALLSTSLESGQLYRLRAAGVRNVNDLVDGGGEAEVAWTRPDPPPVDSSALAPDSAVVAPDTLGMVPDSIPPDTGRVTFRGVLSPVRRKRLP
jgi:hypothetical protein